MKDNEIDEIIDNLQTNKDWCEWRKFDLNEYKKYQGAYEKLKKDLFSSINKANKKLIEYIESNSRYISKTYKTGTYKELTEEEQKKINESLKYSSSNTNTKEISDILLKPEFFEIYDLIFKMYKDSFKENIKENENELEFFDFLLALIMQSDNILYIIINLSDLFKMNMPLYMIRLINDKKIRKLYTNLIEEFNKYCKNNENFTQDLLNFIEQNSKGFSDRLTAAILKGEKND